MVAWLAGVVERERGPRERAEHEREEGAFGVVAGDAVGLDDAAGGAAVDDGPLAARAFTDLDGDGVHGRTARAGAVARAVIDVSAGEAGGAVVAVLGAPGLAGDLEFAVDAREAVRLVPALAWL